MTTTLRKLLASGALAALAASLTACGPEDEERPAALQALAEVAPEEGWDMTDLAGVDPAFLGGAALPQALPMQASYDGGYREAPSYDYAPQHEDAYYAPLDEGAYVEDGGSDDYALLALATALGGMLGDAPPDYGFGYDGVEPWAWETGDRYRRYAEPVDGGYRYYYYEPDAYRPFLVSDPWYSYGYREDRLVAVYDRRGRMIDARRAERQRLAARSYYARAERLHRAAERDRRFGVPAPLWERRRDAIERDRREWERARDERVAWQRWEAENRRRLQRQWADEALVRRDAEQRFGGWQRASYRTETPVFYTPQVRDQQQRRLAELRREQAERAERERLAREEARRQRERTEAREAARAEARQEQVRRQQLAERERLQAQRAAAAEAERQRQLAAAREARQQEQARAREAQRQQQAAARREEQQRQALAKREQQQAAALARKEEQQRLAEARREQARLAAAEARRAEAARQRAEQAEARRQQAVQAREAEAEARRQQQAQARQAQAEAKRQAQQEQARQAAEARRAQLAEARAAERAAQQAQAREAQAAERAARQAEQQQARREAARQEAAQARQQAAQERREAAERARADRPARQAV